MKTNPCYRGLVVSLLLSGLAAILGCDQPGGKDKSADEKTPRVDVRQGATVQLLDYDGIQKLIESKRGQVVVMDAWSTSCPPCLKEFPHLVELHKQHGASGLACISLSFDFEGIGTPEEQLPNVEKFLNDQGATFDNVLGSEESDALYRKFQLASVPAVFVYDRQGNLRKRFDNQQAKSERDAFTYEQVGELVKELLNEPAK
jgi:thiol-disulfide isomerase/thioredoxin